MLLKKRRGDLCFFYFATLSHRWNFSWGSKKAAYAESHHKLSNGELSAMNAVNIIDDDSNINGGKYYFSHAWYYLRKCGFMTTICDMILHKRHFRPSELRLLFQNVLNWFYSLESLIVILIAMLEIISSGHWTLCAINNESYVRAIRAQTIYALLLYVVNTLTSLSLQLYNDICGHGWRHRLELSPE